MPLPEPPPLRPRGTRAAAAVDTIECAERRPARTPFSPAIESSGPGACPGRSRRRAVTLLGRALARPAYGGTGARTKRGRGPAKAVGAWRAHMRQNPAVARGPTAYPGGGSESDAVTEHRRRRGGACGVRLPVGCAVRRMAADSDSGRAERSCGAHATQTQGSPP